MTSERTYSKTGQLLTETDGLGNAAQYTYDAAGNLIKETSPDCTTEYTYNAQNRLILGEKDNGESSAYTYNALGIRIENVQVRANENRGYTNAPLSNGSRYIKDYTKAFSDNRAIWQRSWETEIGTVVQNDFETVTRHHISDYLSVANRDILVTEDGSFVVRYVYDESGKRLSAEFDYADGTAIGTQNANGEYGENPASDIAVNDIGKVWYRTSLLNSTLYAVDKDGETVVHMIYDAWGNPLIETYADANLSGLENLNNFTGYTWDETLGLYFAQNRFYDPETHRFTQEDIIKDGSNWYVYCANSPVVYVDWDGLKVPIDAEGKFVQLPTGKIISTKSGANVSAPNPKTNQKPVISTIPKTLPDRSTTEQPTFKSAFSQSIEDAEGAFLFAGTFAISDTPLPGPADVAALALAVGVLFYCAVDAASTVITAPPRAVSISQAEEKTEDWISRKRIVFFPDNPYCFNPLGLVMVVRPGTTNGILITWMDPIANCAVFRWDENCTRSNGPHYHVYRDPEHYLPGMIVPEPYASIYFPM